MASTTKLLIVFTAAMAACSGASGSSDTGQDLDTYQQEFDDMGMDEGPEEGLYLEAEGFTLTDYNPDSPTYMQERSLSEQDAEAPSQLSSASSGILFLQEGQTGVAAVAFTVVPWDR